jgi:CPA1 family monovalent cation:H+ antiporter
LRPLLRWLQLRDDGSVEREVRLARRETLRAALSTAGSSPGAEAAQFLRTRYELLLRRAETELASGHGVEPSASDAELIRAAIAVERQRLSSLRADGTIGDAAFQRVEQDLDLEELDLEQLLRAGDAPAR